MRKRQENSERSLNEHRGHRERDSCNRRAVADLEQSFSAAADAGILDGSQVLSGLFGKNPDVRRMVEHHIQDANTSTTDLRATLATLRTDQQQVLGELRETEQSLRQCTSSVGRLSAFKP